MSFANPAAFVLAALAVPVVIFYILKIRMRRVPVSTVMFWQQIFEEKQPRSIWQRLRHLLSLLLQLAFLALLVAALAEPSFDWQTRQARRVVLVVDNSASMRAHDVRPSRFGHAQGEARRLVDALRQGDEMAIVAAGSRPRVVCGLTGHQRTLREALAGVRESDGPAAVPQAVALARRLLARHENGRIVVLSDGGFRDADGLAKADDVEWIGVGGRTGNVGITKFQVRRSLLDPIGYQILAEVTNFSDDPVELRLEIELGGQLLDVVPLRLEADQRWSQVFEKTSAEGGRLVARLDRPDPLMSDNQAWAILPRRERQQVVLVGGENLFLQKVFEASPLVSLTTAPALPESLPGHAVVVFHRTVPDPLPPGNVLVIEPTHSTEHWQLADRLANPVVAKQDGDSPLMAHVRLDNVLMPEAYRLEPAGGHKVLAESATGDPLYFAVERPEGKLLVLTVNLDRGDFPLRTAFPILMTNALGWFAGVKGELRESLATGTVTEIELPDGADQEAGELVLQAPGGESQPLASDGSKATIGPLDRCGVWRIVRQTPDEPDATLVEIACNLSNPDESDLCASADLPTTTEYSATAGFGSRPVWFYLIAVAWVLAGMEWFLYQRRWIE